MHAKHNILLRLISIVESLTEPGSELRVAHKALTASNCVAGKKRRLVSLTIRVLYTAKYYNPF